MIAQEVVTGHGTSLCDPDVNLRFSSSVSSPLLLNVLCPSWSQPLPGPEEAEGWFSYSLVFLGSAHQAHVPYGVPGLSPAWGLGLGMWEGHQAVWGTQIRALGKCFPTPSGVESGQFHRDSLRRIRFTWLKHILQREGTGNTQKQRLWVHMVVYRNSKR